MRSHINLKPDPYCLHNRQTSVTDARTGTTSFTYFADDQLHTVTTPDPDPARTGPGYDPQTTTYHYDSAGRVDTVTQPDATVVNTSYWPTGAVRRTWGSRTYPVEYAYDPQGRVKTMTTWQNFANASGAAVTTWNYDPARGFLQNKRYADNTGPSYTYKPSGRLLTRTWARGITTTYAYNGAGDLSSVDYSDTTPDVTIAYDRAGRPSTITDGSGIRTLSYDASGQLKDEDYIAGLLNTLGVHRTFDSLSRLGSVSVSSVSSVGYTYDAASRLDTVTSGTNTATYGYVTNSPLVGTILFKQGGSTRLTTTKVYDNLNRTASVGNTPSVSSVYSVGYSYNSANQRTKATREDSRYWDFGYDPLGQVTSANKKLASGTPLLGHDFAYTYDDIGNRKTALTNGQPATYTPNSLNQYTQRTVPGVVDVLGAAQADATVTVTFPASGGTVFPTTRQGELYARQLAVDNSTAALYASVKVTGVKNLVGPSGEDAVTEETRSVLVTGTPEQFSHDADGNLTGDGRWTYTWDGENRLSGMETSAAAATAGVARQKLEFTYDGQGRRVSKKVYSWNTTSSAWQLDSSLLFLYDGWNMVAEMNALSANATVRTYTWGLDLSGSLQGAGGVGGLLAVSLSNGSTHAPAFDGNGNVIGYVDMTTGTKSATYEYGAFGETLIADGPAAEMMPFRFSTKYTDSETGIVMYLRRPYYPPTGRWLCKDPIEEDGGKNLYGFVGNDPTNWIDPLGLVLVAVDGTDSFDWVYGRGANSHVLNFYRDWRGPGRKLYLDGPSASGRGIDAAVEQGTKFICDAIKNNPGEPIFLIGHSRGGLIVTKISEKLNSEGCPCVKNASSVPVRFVGLYDAVNMSTNSNDNVPRNVRDVAHGRRDPSVGSRLLWGNTAQGGGRNYNEQVFKGTHSAMGGDPLHGDVGNPFGEGRESSASDAIDRFVRSNATSAGAQLAPRTP